MADAKISALNAASAVVDANEFEINEAGTSKKVTGAQIKAYVGAAPKPINYQAFTASGTWTKPSGYGTNARVLLEAWGAGGGGRNDSGYTVGGGGGAYNYRWILLSSMGATETITIGAGGAANTAYAAGGNSSVGTLLYAYGGGQDGSGSGGGGQTSAGSGAAGGPGQVTGNAYLRPEGDNPGHDGHANGNSAFMKGGGGGGYSATAGAGGASVWGGGGGGQNGGGASSHAGAGGGNNAAGSAPAGGGGPGGAGARGEIRITVFDGA